MVKSKKRVPLKHPLKILVPDYDKTLAEIKQLIQKTQLKTIITVNKKLLHLYWFIGKTIAEKQGDKSWSTNSIELLAHDLQKDFPGIAGFSRTNIFRMKAFFLAYPNISPLVEQEKDFPIFALPWGHNIVLMEKVKNYDQRLWYATSAINYGWSRSMLETWIDSKLYQREGKLPTNFKKTLPTSQSDLAQQAFKDPYVFDFLTFSKEQNEKDIEQGLINHIQKFLLELGQGFSFVGRQVPLHIDKTDYYIDLLFYHLKLRCFIVVELKARDFDPRDAGQIGFYLAAVDDTLRHKEDNPTIGLILCKTKKSLTVEYALRSTMNPIGVANYETKLFETLPNKLKSNLPTIEEFESELTKSKQNLEKPAKQSSTKKKQKSHIKRIIKKTSPKSHTKTTYFLV